MLRLLKKKKQQENNVPLNNQTHLYHLTIYRVWAMMDDEDLTFGVTPFKGYQKGEKIHLHRKTAISEKTDQQLFAYQTIDKNAFGAVVEESDSTCFKKLFCYVFEDEITKGEEKIKEEMVKSLKKIRDKIEKKIEEIE